MSERASERSRGGATPEEAYGRLTQMVSPNAPREEMQAAISEAFKDVPGFSQAYKESAQINGVWFDLVGGYEGPNANFHGLMAKQESPSSMRSLGGFAGMGASGYSRIPTPANPTMPAMVRPPIQPLPAVARAAYVPLAAPAMADLAFPEVA